MGHRMRDFPQELIIGLLFGVVLLVQFLFKQLRRKALSMQAQDTPQAEARPAAAPLASTRTPAQADPDEAPLAIEELRAVRHAPPARTSPQNWRHAGRFSRLRLMHDRRAVQDAIVIAAILRPCHARQPHEVE